MNNELKKHCEKLQKLTDEEKVLRDLYLRKLNLGEIQGPLTGYASIDKPNLRYYKEEHITAPIPRMTITEYFEECNKDNLDGIIYDAPDGIYTVRQFRDAYRQTAASLAQLGITKGDKIMTLLTPMVLETIALYGGSLLGACDTGIPEFSTPEEVCKAINKMDVKVLFTTDYLLTEEMERQIYANTNIEHIIFLNFGSIREYDARTITYSEFLAKGFGKEIPDNDVKNTDTIYISQTGGSTGEPKCVELSSDSFNIAVHQYLNSDLDYKRGDTWIRMWSLFSASATVSNSHLPLCAGMINILRNFPYENMDKYEDILLDTKANHQMVIPQTLDVLERSKKINNSDLSFIKSFGCGGMAITSEFENRINRFIKLHRIYTFLGYGWGCTENATSAAMRSNFATTKIGFVGSPLVKTVVSVFDDNGDELPYGVEGELAINSYTIMNGYYNDKELTEAVIKIHPDGSRWLHPGDLGFITQDGLVKVTGRKTRFIFTAGEKIYPTVMENTLSKIHGVRDIAVCKMPDLDNPGCDVPVCFFVPNDISKIEEVRQYIEMVCTQIYAEGSRPRLIIGKDEMPLNKVGKPNILLLENELLQMQEKNQSRNRVKKG